MALLLIRAIAACLLGGSLALGASMLVYFRIHRHARQAYPHADLPEPGRFQPSSERLALSLYRRAYPRSPLVGIYRALSWLGVVALLFVPVGLLLANFRPHP